MIVGRVIFGIGSEVVYALKSTFTSLWFHDQEISTAMGANSCLAYLLNYFAGFWVP